MVWASAKPNNGECAAPAHWPETFTLHAPVGDRPVVDEHGALVWPHQ